ncbi:L,D-transpeptidase [Microvirga mediterraneensis]|uniref:L,D-transpeptidase n=1 Tax=Microvirga mediterraneensis TaxID=2754695 RepID=A0A838BV03_9HYPH|nr:L,D-transpeptidase [Microvirga mediterraneensis]MBA1158879.1 L,D-transpeptidase [Microvirga mediterraneensis]
MTISKRNWHPYGWRSEIAIACTSLITAVFVLCAPALATQHPPDASIGAPAPDPAPPSEIRRRPSHLSRVVVPFASSYEAGTILVDTRGRRLLRVLSPTRAVQYPIGVGRQGFTWTGELPVSRKASWPDWRPPKEMRQRDPRLPAFMQGGPKNPLGARAIYLGETLYRIHGTNEPGSIGRAVSSGCFRMFNEDIIDLARRTPVGTRVVVFDRLTQTAASPIRKPTLSPPAPLLPKLGNDKAQPSPLPVPLETDGEILMP